MTTVARAPGAVELRVQVTPPWPFAMPRFLGLDRLYRRRGEVLHRLLHRAEQPVHVRVRRLSADRVLFGARAADRELAAWGIERMRRALGVDCDLEPFYERFRGDPLIGPSVRIRRELRVTGRPDPFEALAWAICEQLIEYERAAAIQRRLIWRLGRHDPASDLRDGPSAATIAAQAPARLASLGLTDGRALTLHRAAREVAAGRVDLAGPEPERGWRRLRAIPGIGSWTAETLALRGQGRLDQLPAGDLAYVTLVGRLIGAPGARATEEQVRAFFAPYHPWAALAGVHALHAAATGTAGARAARLAA